MKRIKKLAERLRELKETKVELGEALKKVNKEIGGYRDGDDWVVGVEVALADAMIEADMKSAKFSFGTVYLQEDVRPNVTHEDEFFAWLKANGRGQAIKRTVHFQTLRGICNELKADFKPLPPGVETNDRTIARIRRK